MELNANEVNEPKDANEPNEALESQVQTNLELDNLKTECNTLKQELAKVRGQLEEAHRTFINHGEEPKKKRDFNTLVEDIQ